MLHKARRGKAAGQYKAWQCRAGESKKGHEEPGGLRGMAAVSKGSAEQALGQGREARNKEGQISVARQRKA